VSIFETKTEQKRNKIRTKTSSRTKQNKSKHIKTQQIKTNQNQAFAIFFVSVLIPCDFVVSLLLFFLFCFVFVLINGHLSVDMYCTCRQAHASMVGTYIYKSIPEKKPLF